MQKSLTVLFIMLALASCTKEEIRPRDYPVVMTREVTNVSGAGASFKAEITYSSSAITDYGFIYTIIGFPTLTNTNATKQSFGVKAGVGPFDYSVGKLQVGKTYAMCAYAVTSKNIVYGRTIEFIAK